MAKSFKVTISAEVDDDLYDNLVSLGYSQKEIEKLTALAFARIPVTTFIDNKAPIFDYEVTEVKLNE